MNQDPFPAIQKLSVERLLLITNLCRSLNQDMHSAKLHFSTEESANLIQAGEELFSRLASADRLAEHLIA